jgi:hypothetical protein
MICGTVALLALGAFAKADAPAHTESTITAPEVEVRSGPSPKFYPTTKLHQGDRVRIVEHKEGDWLAIEPPAGSFSWINQRMIDFKEGSPTALVMASDTPVLIGSTLTNEEPSVQALVKLQRGTQLVILSRRMAYKSDSSAWLPIQPTPQEVRYIPASAVAQSAPVQSTSSAAPAAAAGTDPMLTQAEQAEKAGNKAEAERLYTQLAQQTKDQNIAILCYNRIHFLREGNAGYNTVNNQPRPNSAYGSSSQYTYFREGQPPPGSQPPAAGNAVAAPRWSEPGWLRRAAFQIDCKPTYALESSQAQLRLYVTAQPGVNLEPYVNRTVNLYGPMWYSGEVKTNYMTVSQVVPVP